MSPAMTLERFAVIVDAYGAEPRRWPAAERESASALAASDPEAAALLAEARALDAGLDALPLPAAATAGQRRTAMPAPELPSRWQEFLGLLGGWKLAVPAMAMALVAGLDVGMRASRSDWAAVAVPETASAGSSPLAATGFAESLILDLESRKP
jgi:hypothetical protein